MLLEMEVCRVTKIVKSKKFCLLCRTKDVEYFLNEGQIYLNITNILHERNQKMSEMFMIMLKVMDIYSKLKMHLRDKEFDWKINEELNNEEEEEEEEEEEDDLNIIPVEFEISDSDESEVIDFSKVCLHCLCQIYYREFLLANIESLITRIKSLYVAFTGSSSALYIMLHLMLRDYCKRAKLFLHDNTRIMESKQERLPRGDYYKYDLLEQLLTHVSKEQESVAKYVDIKFKKENGKSSD